MFGFLINSLILLAAPAAAAAEGGSSHFYDDYMNVPGFELWKFLNLGIFIAILIYIAKKPLSEAFKAKREQIRAELIQAEAEKQAALDKLVSAEARLAQLETEKESVLAKAKAEGEFERKRLEEQTRSEVERLRQQSEAEIARISGQSRAELRRFSAEESIRLAEEKLRAQIDSQKDANLVRSSIQQIGGLN